MVSALLVQGNRNDQLDFLVQHHVCTLIRIARHFTENAVQLVSAERPTVPEEVIAIYSLLLNWHNLQRSDSV